MLPVLNMQAIGNAPVADLHRDGRILVVASAAAIRHVNDQISGTVVSCALLRNAILQAADLECSAAFDREQKFARLFSDRMRRLRRS